MYEKIRGKGYAYGVSIKVYTWYGQLSFELYRCSEPQKALSIFYDMLNDMKCMETFDKICSLFEIETAKSSVIFQWISQCSTPTLVISTALKSSIQGFQSLQEYYSFIDNLSTVTGNDLRRVFTTYFVKFLDMQNTAIVISTPSEEIEEIRKSFELGQMSFRITNCSSFT